MKRQSLSIYADPLNSYFFFFNDTATTEIYTLSLHDALPISFINLIGIYPVGTCVILDTYEVALVHSANPDVTHVHRPVVRIVTTPEGGVQHPGFLADLAQKDAEGNHPRSIVKVTDPV